MANKSSWWKLEITNTEDDDEIKLSDNDKNHIASQIIKGFTEGEIVSDDD